MRRYRNRHHHKLMEIRSTDRLLCVSRLIRQVALTAIVLTLAAPNLHAQENGVSFATTTKQIKATVETERQTAAANVASIYKSAREQVADPNVALQIDDKISTILAAQETSTKQQAQEILTNLPVNAKLFLANKLEAQNASYVSYLNEATKRNFQVGLEERDYLQRVINANLNASLAFRSQNELPPEYDRQTAESIVNTTRLAYLICGDRITDANRIVYWQADISSFISSFSKKIFGSVGRLEYYTIVNAPDGTARVQGDATPFATTFAIGPKRLMTNAHVLASIATYDSSEHTWTMRKDRAIFVNFGAEYTYNCTVRAANRFRVSNIKNVEGQLDAAILETYETMPIPAIDIEPNVEVHPGEAVVVIGFPGEDDQVLRAEQTHVLVAPDGVTPYSVKRFQPGVVKNPIGLPAYKPDRDFQHDASSLKGSSGSPVFRMADGKFIGMHHDGYPRKANVATKGTLIQNYIGVVGTQ